MRAQLSQSLEPNQIGRRQRGESPGYRLGRRLGRAGGDIGTLRSSIAYYRICAWEGRIGTGDLQKKSTRPLSDHPPAPRVRMRGFRIPGGGRWIGKPNSAWCGAPMRRRSCRRRGSPTRASRPPLPKCAARIFSIPDRGWSSESRATMSRHRVPTRLTSASTTSSAFLTERHLNNGQPSLHAKLLAHAGPREGDHVAHVGAGTGYYTAITAHLVGRSGKVTAIELDPDLANRARVNLSSYPNVSVICGNGAAVPVDAADVIYVNAGATR